MSGFPDEVEGYYVELAERRGWSEETSAAIRATVELIRDLDRGTAPRTYGAVVDDHGTDWLYEAVWHEREWVVVRQLGVGEDGKTSILLLRVGEAQQGVVGLQKVGVTGEVEPGLSVRYMGTNKRSVASHLVTRYFSLAKLGEDALASLDDVSIGNYHEYVYPTA